MLIWLSDSVNWSWWDTYLMRIILVWGCALFELVKMMLWAWSHPTIRALLLHLVWLKSMEQDLTAPIHPQTQPTQANFSLEIIYSTEVQKTFCGNKVLPCVWATPDEENKGLCYQPYVINLPNGIKLICSSWSRLGRS